MQLRTQAEIKTLESKGNVNEELVIFPTLMGSKYLLKIVFDVTWKEGWRKGEYFVDRVHAVIGQFMVIRNSKLWSRLFLSKKYNE